MRSAYLGATLALVLTTAPAIAQNVKVTPVGSHPGELCANDRATLFEDPSGVRILYDAGQTVTGADDARLGEIHVVLLSHAHGDHIGDQKLKAVGAGQCANSERIPATPNSTTAEIAAAKNAAIPMTSDMGTFIGRKVQNIRGKPVAVCPQTDGVTTVPVATSCRSNTHLGGGEARQRSRTLLDKLQIADQSAIHPTLVFQHASKLGRREVGDTVEGVPRRIDELRCRNGFGNR